jgi:hypothetical protein
MKFQPFNQAWKETVKKDKVEVKNEPKQVVLKEIKTDTIVVPVLNTKDFIQEEVKKEIVKMDEKKEVIESINPDTFIQEEEINYKPKTFKDYMIVTLIVIVFLMFLWNLYSMNEIKRLYQNQEKMLEIFLKRLLKE